MPGRTFTRKCKLEIMRRLACGEQCPAQVCREHGMADSTLTRWRKEYAERGEAPRPALLNAVKHSCEFDMVYLQMRWIGFSGRSIS
jgi:transposase-like protein